ncbi:MAG: c-type cytochrome [bacterium]
MHRGWIGVGIFCMALMFFGCEDNGYTTSPVGGGSGGGANIFPRWSGSQGLGEFFRDRCTSCHRPGGTASFYDLTTYEGALTRVRMGSDPDESKLVRRLTGREQPRMPMGGPYLTNAEIDTVRAWIRVGAPR